jgi:two-component system, OmpR family, alkaline phosphatase synthesis response regulator PhoP
MSQYVLLCDDEVHIVRAAEIKLTRAGYEVEVAGDGEEAWQKILARRPDMIVTDLQMPRLDGLGLVQRLRENPPTSEVPVVMLTAKGFELSFEELAARWHIQKLMAKPFSPRELLDVVNKTLRPELAEAGTP